MHYDADGYEVRPIRDRAELAQLHAELALYEYCVLGSSISIAIPMRVLASGMLWTVKPLIGP